MEMRAFIEKGDILLERYENGVDSRTNIVRALKVSSLAKQIELTSSIRATSFRVPTEYCKSNSLPPTYVMILVQKAILIK